MKILIIGNLSTDLSDWATKEFSNSQLLTDQNFEVLLDTDVVFTTVADISSKNLVKAFSLADRIIFHNSTNWDSPELKEYTMNLLASSGRFIENFVGDCCGFLPVPAPRASDNMQLWIVGCSFAHGWRLRQDQVYGAILSSRLGITSSFLTLNGSSIDWAADQILRSNLKASDVIVWGVTGVGRFMHTLDGTTPVPINPASLNSSNPFFGSIRSPRFAQQSILSPDRLMWAIKYVYQVQNICELVGCNLVVIPHYTLSLAEHRDVLSYYLRDLPGYLELSDPVDFQEDQKHPGVQTQNVWAEEIASFIKQQGWAWLYSASSTSVT